MPLLFSSASSMKPKVERRKANIRPVWACRLYVNASDQRHPAQVFRMISGQCRQFFHSARPLQFFLVELSGFPDIFDNDQHVFSVSSFFSKPRFHCETSSLFQVFCHHVFCYSGAVRFAPPSGHRCVCQRTLGGDNGQHFNQSLCVQS